MSATDYLILFSGVTLEILIVARGYVARLYRTYPFFFGYIAYVLLMNLAQFILRKIGLPHYVVTYWVLEAGAIVCAFLVLWEIFRQTFSATHSLNRIAKRFVLWLLFSESILVLSFGTHSGPFFSQLERKVGLLQASWLALMLLLAGYYRVPLGRNVRGMAFGYGIYVAISISNFAAYELTESFLPFWRYIHPLSYLAALVLWTWGLWFYSPNPPIHTTEIPAPVADEMRAKWSSLRVALKRIIGL